MTVHELNMLEFDDWYKIKKQLIPQSFDEYVKEHYVENGNKYQRIVTSDVYTLDEVQEMYRETFIH